MSERNQIVVVLIVALMLGAFVDRSTALKIVAGVALLWTLQNQPTVFECIRKLFSLRRGGLRFENTAEAQQQFKPLRVVVVLARVRRFQRSILTK